LPGDEETLSRIWDEAPDWISLVRPAIEPERRQLYQNKHLLSAFLQGRGVLIPGMRLLEEGTLQEILSIVEALGLPVVVKGAGGSGGNQVRIVDSAAEALQAVTELSKKTGMLPALQQYLAGGTYLVAGVFDHGRPLRMICAELVEMLPPRTGPSILLTSRNEPDLLDTATGIFQTLGFTGLACADFVRGGDGRFRFLELNPRHWGSYGFTKALGVEMAGPWCRMQRGERVPSELGYPVDRTWAKMPSYLTAPPLTRLSMLRRAAHLVALRSWHWRAPNVFYHQLREAYWEFLAR
jgi:biotin carboxylase